MAILILFLKQYQVVARLCFMCQEQQVECVMFVR